MLAAAGVNTQQQTPFSFLLWSSRGRKRDIEMITHSFKRSKQSLHMSIAHTVGFPFQVSTLFHLTQHRLDIHAPMVGSVAQVQD